jgi:hypothetical protein
VTGNGPLPFPIGAAVRLRGCAFGEPDAVLRIERRKVVVYWRDLDFLSRHLPESLELAETPDARRANAPANEKTADCFRCGGRGLHAKGTR